MSVISHTDGMGWNLGGGAGTLPSLIRVENDLHINGEAGELD